MTLTISTFSEEFSQPVPAANDGATLLAQLREVHASAVAALFSAVSTLVEHFKARLTQDDVLGCSHCLDRMMEFESAFACHLDCSASWTPLTELYVQMQSALWTNVKGHHDEATELLRRKRLHNLTARDVLAVQTAMAVLVQACDPKLEVHNDSQGSLAGFRPSLQASLTTALKNAQVEFTELRKVSPATAFAEIRQRLKAIATLRDDPAVCNCTIQAYNDVTEAVKALVQGVRSELNNLMLRLEVDRWDIQVVELGSLLQQLRSAAVLSDLPGGLYQDEYRSVEQRLVDILQKLDHNLELADFTVQSPAALEGFLEPLQVVADLKSFYEAGSGLSGPSTAVADGGETGNPLLLPLGAVQSRVADKLRVLLNSLEVYFPVDGDLSGYRMDLHITWAAAHLVDTAAAFGCVDCSAVATRVQRFSTTHAQHLDEAMRAKFAAATNELGAVKEEELSSKRQAAQELADMLYYVRSVHDFSSLHASSMMQRKASEAGAASGNAGESKMLATIFRGVLQQLHATWMDRVDGKVSEHLSQFVAINTKQLVYADIVSKWQVARAMAAVDYVLQLDRHITGEARCYDAVVHALEVARREVKDSVSMDIQAENYEKVSEFFGARDLKDPVQRANLAEPLRELSAKVDSTLADVKQKAGSVVISTVNLPFVLEIVSGLSKLRCAHDCVLGYLDPHLKTSLADGLLHIEDQLLTSIKRLVAAAEDCISDHDFAEAEQMLQATQQIIAGMFGSLKGYEEVMGRRGVPPADRLDIVRVRTQVSAVVSDAGAALEAVLLVIAQESVAASTATSRTPAGLGGSRSSGIARLAPLITGVPNSGPLPQATAAADSGVVRLRQILRDHPPNALVDSLLRAMACSPTKLYQQEAEAFLAYLKAKLVSLCALCQNPDLSRDYKESLLQVLDESQPFLPWKLLPELSTSIGACKAAITADAEAVERKRLAAQQSSNLGVLHNDLCHYAYHGCWKDCNHYKVAVCTIIGASVAACEQDTREGKLGAVLARLPSAWKQWGDYFRSCQLVVQLNLQARRGNCTVTVVAGSAEEELQQRVNGLARTVGAALRKSFAEAQAIRSEDSRIFPLLKAQFDLAATLYLEICCDKSLKSLKSELLHDWPESTLTGVVKKVVESFQYYNAHIASLISARDLDVSQLLLLLDNYAGSNPLYHAVEELAASERSALFKLGDFKRLYKPFKAVVDTTVTPRMAQLVSATKVALLRHEQLSKADATALSQFYASLYCSYRVLAASKPLQQYVNAVVVNLAEAERECDAHLATELKKIGQFLIRDLLGATAGLRESDYGKFSIWYDNMFAFKEAFDGTTLGQEAGAVMYQVQQKFVEMVAGMVQAASEPMDDAALVRHMCAIKQLSVGVLSFKREVDQHLDRLLSYVRSETGAQRIIDLGILLSARADDPIAQMIVNQHKAFEGNQLLLFNTKVARSSAEDILVDGPDGLRGDGIDRAVLWVQYELFRREYEALVSVGLLDPTAAARRCIDRAKEIASASSGTTGQSALTTFTITLKATVSGSSRATILSVDTVRGLMVQLFVHWTLSKSEHYFEVSKGTAGQQLDEDSRRKYLQQPHAGQVLTIFRILGFDRGGEVRNHFVQIGTGEGKSIVIAIAACILALLGYGVDCACYSEYLSKRDCSSFAQMFREFHVQEYIQYSTFHQLCERYLNCRGDIRTGVEAILNAPPTAEWHRGKATPSRLSSRTKRVLLIDEADVFFNKDFYGSAYRPLAKLSDPTVAALLDYIWSVRAANPRLATVKDSAEFKACAAKYSKWQHLLEEAVKSLLFDLQSFESHEYKIVGDRIGYKDQDGVSCDITYGYKTLFAYYKAHAERKISAASLQNMKCIAIDCGSYSFAEIPKLYNLVLGVSGTLETLSAPEQAILRDEYRIRLRTIMPSVYSSNNMDFQASAARDVKIESSGGHFAAITNEIRQRRTISSDRTIRRPVLVFFETATQLVQYVNSPAAVKYKAAFRVITEETSESEKDNYIRFATTLGAITLLSREFGRGTDFMIYDERVRQAGGLHVIQTFLSEELSEETQIKGRAARQGCRGSYSMVLSQLSLEKYGIQLRGPRSVQEMKAKGNYEEVLTRKRDAYFNSKYAEMVSYVARIRDDHVKAMDFLQQLATVPIEADARKGVVPAETVTAIGSFLLHRNKCNGVVNAGTVARTIVLMDATGSMSQLLDKAKTTVKDMFTRARDVIANTKNCETSAFELQFAVYRNYNAPEDHLLQHSGWESDSDNLFRFMDTIRPEYGMGNEAIEIGLWHANQEVSRKVADQRYQVILIGDMPPNTVQQVSLNRGHKGEAYWSQTRFKESTHYEAELRRLVAHQVPVHAFYVRSSAREAFQVIAGSSGGQCQSLDVETSAGAETLTTLVTERILEDVGGGGAAGQALVEEYRRMFVKGYMK